MSVQDYTGPGLRDFVTQTRPTPTPDAGGRPSAGGDSPGTAAADTPRWSTALLEATQQVLRDPQRLDPRWRDPLSPPTERHAAVVSALMRAVRDAREGRAPALWSALREVPTTDEPTLLSLYDAALGWGPLQAEFDQPEVTEIKIIGSDVLIYPSGAQPVRRRNPLSMRETEARARILAQDAGMPLNDREPARSVALGYGTRFTAVVGPRAIEPLLVFRRGRRQAWTLPMLVSRGSLSADVAALLTALMGLGLSGLVIGATASGKTVVLETLLATLPDHLITIEDGAQELMLPDDTLWTRQVVDVVADQGALRDALRTVLRQTPRAVAVGECRGAEAGQILTLAQTDHQVWTTVHAEDGAGALRRLATLASAMDADYAGRFEDALRDAVQAMPLLVTTRYWGQIGRRLITSVELATGVARDATGSMIPVTVPLARVRVDRATQTVDWEVLAQLNDTGDALLLTAGTPLPEALIQRIQQGAYRIWSSGETGQTPLARTQVLLQRAQRHLDSGQPDRALAELRRAWAIRQDTRTILPLVATCLERLPEESQAAMPVAAAANAQVQQLQQQRRWHDLWDALALIQAEVTTAALLTTLPWDALAAQIQTGLAVEVQLIQVIQAVPERIAAGASRETLSALDALERRWLSAAGQARLEQARIAVLRELVRCGEADPQALAAASAAADSGKDAD